MNVSHHLYAEDQFCGFWGSLGPSHVTNAGTVGGVGEVPSTLASASWTALLESLSKDLSTFPTTWVSVDLARLPGMVSEDMPAAYMSKGKA